MAKDDHTVQQPDYSGEKMKMPENSAMPATDLKSSRNILSGPVLIILTLLLLLILVGLYYWFMIFNNQGPVATPDADRPTAEENNEPESTTAETQVEAMQTMSTSDEISAIEADLEATDLESLDTEINAIEAELNAAATQ